MDAPKVMVKYVQAHGACRGRDACITCVCVRQGGCGPGLCIKVNVYWTRLRGLLDRTRGKGSLKVSVFLRQALHEGYGEG